MSDESEEDVIDVEDLIGDSEDDDSETVITLDEEEDDD